MVSQSVRRGSEAIGAPKERLNSLTEEEHLVGRVILLRLQALGTCMNNVDSET